MKYALSSKEYNDLFKNARDTFDNELIKRDLAIANMTKKLRIMDCANTFIEEKINSINNTAEYDKKLVTFYNGLNGNFTQYGYSVHPKFKREPIDIFNLKLSSGDTMFKNSLICKVNDEEITNPDDELYYTNFLISDNSIEKKIMFTDIYSDQLKIEYMINPNNKMALGISRFNVIEIDPYIYGAYSIKSIEVFSLSEVNGIVSEVPIKTISSISNIGKIRVILDEKVKFSKVVFYFDLSNMKSFNGKNDVVYPFGLRHIHFYEADFLEDSHVIVSIRANDFIEYIYNKIMIYHAGNPIDTTCEYYDIEVYTDYINGTLTGKVYTSSDAAAYRIAKNTKVLYAKIPLIWTNKANTDKQYLSLSGILFDYTVDEDIFG